MIMYSSISIESLMSKAGLLPTQILLDHYQRIYTYQLLAFFDDHPIKNIFLISF